MIGKDNDKTFLCGACKRTSILKNNRAVVEEYRRLRGRFKPEPDRDACKNPGCENCGKPASKNPDLYRKTGKTAGGTQRWKCKACLQTFSIGSRIRRQKRSHLNRDIFWLLTHEASISKICDFTGLCARDVYAKIDFIYKCVVDFTARREGQFKDVNWGMVGRRFASDSQTLFLNWPNKRTRAQIQVPHLCTAHANTGYIMAAHLALDPEADVEAIEEEMLKCDDFELPRAFRLQARVWSETEFEEYLDKMTRGVKIHPFEAPYVSMDLQLPHVGAMVRQDIMQLAHAFYIRRCLGKTDDRFTFVLDSDSGLALSFVSAFAPLIKARRVDVAVVKFDKYQSNDQRNYLVQDGLDALYNASGIGRSEWYKKPVAEKNEILDEIIEKMLKNHICGTPFDWPFHTKSEPLRSIRLLTDHPTMDPRRRARLMRLSTLRSVDSYFHKVRSNLRFAARPGHTPSSNHRAWDRHYLYNPATMVKLVEIYRFAHNWLAAKGRKSTPAMKLGLAKGPIDLKDLFA